MDIEALVDRTLGRLHLSHSAAEGKEERPCIFPPINPAALSKEREDPAQLALQEHQRKVDDNKYLLVLTRIEEELRDSLRREVERQREINVIRQEENRLRWRTLCFLQLNQRLKKPVVTSYYKNIPMHIYCLPIQTVGKGDGNKKEKKKWQR
ncbi:hypothetical protein J4Q44_G00369460 [Coregonus suidteri]|uniref:Uncharacterized protein n=1 Tax=Coregonus suidteri TaxID=861788 RepID=A0AAN8KJ33_9TELE